MEPVSAFVGFAASIVTLSAVVANSCKTIHNVWHSLKDAPQDVGRLLRKMKRLEKVILDIETAAVQLGNDSSRIDSQQYWVDQIAEMVEDFTILNDKINKMQAILTAKKLSRNNLSARVRKFFSEDDIVKYESILSSHLQTFNVMYCLQSRYGLNNVFLILLVCEDTDPQISVFGWITFFNRWGYIRSI